jgi:hypothetical protein
MTDEDRLLTLAMGAVAMALLAAFVGGAVFGYSLRRAAEASAEVSGTQAEGGQQ